MRELAKQEGAPRLPGAEPEPPGRVLLAEDHPVNRRVAKAMLEHLGFEVDVVGNGVEAVDAVRLTPYQAILMDCQLPVLDGCRATREIRRLEGAARRTPIIAVTASPSASGRQSCLDAGMDAYLAKPLTVRTLGRALNQGTADGSAATRFADPPNALPDANGARPILDVEVVGRLERLGKNTGQDLMGQLAVLFMADADSRVIELREALAAEDAATVVRSAHTLSGSSASLGATDLAHLCTALERCGATGVLTGGSALLDAVEAELGRVRSALGPWGSES